MHQHQRHHLCRTCNSQHTLQLKQQKAAEPIPTPLLFDEPHQKHLSTVERSAIVVLDKLKYTHQEIRQQLSVSQPTVRHWINRYDEKKDVSDAPRSGRTRCTDEETDAAVVGAWVRIVGCVKQIYLVVLLVTRRFLLHKINSID